MDWSRATPLRRIRGRAQAEAREACRCGRERDRPPVRLARSRGWTRRPTPSPRTSPSPTAPWAGTRPRSSSSRPTRRARGLGYTYADPACGSWSDKSRAGLRGRCDERAGRLVDDAAALPQPRRPASARWRSAPSTARSGISRRACSTCHWPCSAPPGTSGVRERRLHHLHRRAAGEQLRGWAEQGLRRSRSRSVGARARPRPRERQRQAIGPTSGCSSTPTAPSPQAGPGDRRAMRDVGVTGSRSRCRPTTWRGCGCARPGAGRDGGRGRRVRLRPVLVPAAARRRRGGRAAGRCHPLRRHHRLPGRGRAVRGGVPAPVGAHRSVAASAPVLRGRRSAQPRVLP